MSKNVIDMANITQSAPAPSSVFASPEVNLVPDIKFELIKTKAARTRIMVISFIVVVASVVATAIIASVTFGVQSLMIADVDRRINEQFDKYKNYNGVNQIITIQNQLSKIDSMHQDKPISSRLFVMMVSIIDGSGGSVKISKLNYDKNSNEVRIEGQSRDAFVGVEKFQKSILATQISYKPKTLASSTNAENNGSESSTTTEELTDQVYAIEQASYGQNVSGESILMFHIGFKVNQKMFDSTSDVTLIGAARKDVTDSTLSIPQNIFAPKAQEPETRLGE